MKQKSCTVQEADLLLWHYRELPEEQQSRLQDHLAACADCRRRLEELSRTLAVFPPREMAWSPTDQRRLAVRVAEGIHNRRQKPATARLWFGSAAAAAALLIAVTVPWRSEMINPLPATPANPTILAEMEMLENIEFWQTLDLLQELDILEELEPLG